MTARVGGREGLGAAARKRAEAARRVAAELEQQQKQKSQPGGKMNNFRGMGAPPRPTGSFGYQQQQQQQQPPTRSPAAPPSADTGDSRWTPVSQRPLTAARPSFGRRGVSSHPRRPEDQNQNQNQNYSPPPESSVPGRAYARPPSHGAHSRQYHDDDAGDGGDGIALYNEGVRRDSSAAGDERSREGNQIGLFRQQRPPPSREYPPSHGRRAGGGVDTPASSYGGGYDASPPQPQPAPPLHYPRAPPSASSELAERPGVLQSDRAVRYAQFVRGLRDVDARAINAVSDAQNARVKRDVENLRVVNGVYQPGARGGVGGVGQNRSHPSGGEANRSQLPAQDTYGYGYRPGNQPGHWRSDDKSNAHNGYRVRRDGFDREGKSAYGSSSESNLNTSPRWGEGLGQARATARLEHQTKVDARQQWDAARRMREARESGARHVELAGLRGAPRVAQGYPKPPTPGEESRVVRYGRRAMRDMY